MDSKDSVEELSCALTDEELLEQSQRLAALHQKKNHIESRKKAAVADFGAQLKEVEGRVSLLSNNIRNKKESRNVECRTDYDWNEGKKYLVRLDTGAAVRESVICEFERQQHMDFMKGQRPKNTEEESSIIEVKAEESKSSSPEPVEPKEQEPVEPEDDGPEIGGECEPEVGETEIEEEVFQEVEGADSDLGEQDISSETPEPVKQDRKLHKYACKACGNMFNDPDQIQRGEDEAPLDVCPNCQSSNFS